MTVETPVEQSVKLVKILKETQKRGRATRRAGRTDSGVERTAGRPLNPMREDRNA